MNIWEEKNYIGPKKNSLSFSDSAQNDITNGIKNDSIKSKCNDIGLVRNCPKCKSSIQYKNINALRVGEKKNTTCKPCQNLSLSRVNIGKRLSSSTKKKLSISMKGRTFSEETRKKISERRKSYFDKNPGIMSGNNNPMFGVRRLGKKNPNYGKYWTKEQRKICGLISKERILKQIYSGDINRHKKGHVGNWYNKKGCEFMSAWSKENGYNLRHALNKGEFYYNGYFADGYDSDKNIWFEYDEKHHYYVNGELKQKDIDRMNNIIQNLKCKFYRYNEQRQELREYTELYE